MYILLRRLKNKTRLKKQSKRSLRDHLTQKLCKEDKRKPSCWAHVPVWSHKSFWSVHLFSDMLSMMGGVIYSRVTASITERAWETALSTWFWPMSLSLYQFGNSLNASTLSLLNADISMRIWVQARDLQIITTRLMIPRWLIQPLIKLTEYVA